MNIWIKRILFIAVGGAAGFAFEPVSRRSFDPAETAKSKSPAGASVVRP